MTSKCVKSTCPYCGVGCGVEASTNKVIGDTLHPANLGSLCVKGSALKESLDMPSRLLYPRLTGKHIAWDSATDMIAEKIHNAICQHGPNSVAMYVSGQILTEDYYVANKLMKGYVGSANIDTNSRLCMSSAVAAHVRAFGEDVVPVNYEDINQADLLVLVGSNAAWTHPILFKRIQLAREDNPNLKIVVIDPRRTMTAEQADLFLPISNDGDTLLFNGLARYLIANDHADYSFIDEHTNGFESLNTELCNSKYQIDEIAQSLNLSSEDISDFYEIFSVSKKVMTLFCQGINQAEGGVDKGNAIINTHLISGQIGKPGCGPFSLTGQPNAMGGREVGGLANQLAVHRGFDEESCSLVQSFWKSPTIATEPGLKAVSLFDAVDKGDIKVLWIMATNPVVSMPNSDLVRKALEKCDFVIVSDITQDSDVANYADLLLPAAGWGEKQGMVTNSERRMSRQRRFIDLPGETKPDWWAISEVGRKVCERLGVANGFDFSTEKDVFREYAGLTGINKNSQYKLELSALATLSDEELEQWKPTSWPLDQRSPYDDLKFSTPSGKANLIVALPTDCTHDGWWLNTGRSRDQWHTMTRTGHVARLGASEMEPMVYINQVSASSLGLKPGQMAKLSEVNGPSTFIAKVAIDEGLTDKQLFMSMHWAGLYSGASQANKVVKAIVDPISGQPAFKSSQINIEPISVVHYGLHVTNSNQTFESDYVSLQREERANIWRFASSLALDKESLPESNGAQKLSIDIDDGWLTVSIKPSGDKKVVQSIRVVSNKPITLDSQVLVEMIERPLDIKAVTQVSPDNEPTKTVCSCFRISDKQIKRVMDEQGLTELVQVQQQLKCGTNCGSCVPEVKQVMSEHLIEVVEVEE